MHRRSVDMVPAQLRSYDRADWERPGDKGWQPAFQRWKAARAAWVAAHPGSQALGNGVERMRAEYQAQFSSEHYPPDAEAWG
jgi:hypothetical protein